MPFIVRQSLRRLTHDWRFALTTIVTLGLAIAANTVIFGAAYTVLWRPLPMANAERLLTLWNGYPGDPGKAAVAVQEYFEYRDQLETFEGLAAVRDSAVNLTGAGEPQRLNGLLVSLNLGRVLGITPAIGRDFVESDGAVGGRMVLLSHHVWRQTFGSDPHVVGQPIRLDGNAYRVAGILPAGLVFPDAASFSMPRQADLWIAETWDRLRDDSRGNQFLRVIGLPSSVISYIVTQSTREIGIRIALGSTQGALVRRLIVRAGIWTLCGVTAGLFGAAAVSRALSSLLFQVSPVDPETFLFAAGATFVIALLSTYLPARTIIRLDPVDAIKA